MDLTEIKKHLESFEKDIEEIFHLFEKKPEGYREEIKQRYTTVKNLLKAERDKVQTQKGEREATEEEKQCYYPAVNEAWLELYTKAGSGPSREMMNHLSSAQSNIRYYQSQIKT